MNESEIYNNIDNILINDYPDEKGYRKKDLIGDKKCENVTDELTAFVMNNFVLDIVSKPLSDLKKLLAEMTIKLITTEPDCEEKHKLVRDIEIAKESINALK